MAIKWGVMGTASIAEGCIIPAMANVDDCELYAIAGRDETKTKKFKERFCFKKFYIGYDALLEDSEIQAVYIPLPNNMHYEWVIKALKAGKHVLCEKPLALNAEEARLMYKTAEENDVILAEAFAYLHSPYIKALKNDIQSKIIGDIEYIETAFLTQGYKDNIRLYKELGGGAVYDLGGYCISMILSLLDSPVSYIKASAEKNENDVDIFTSGILRFNNGTRASFNVAMVFGAESNSRFDRLYIHGTNGYIRSDVEYNQAGELKYTIISDGKCIERVIKAKNNYSLELEQMNRVILGREPQLITPEFSIKTAEMIDKILASIA